MFLGSAFCIPRDNILIDKIIFLSNIVLSYVSFYVLFYFQEFDRQAAKKVQHLFDEIDSVLFEKQSNQAEYIKTECQEWGSQFPHLR